MFRQRGVLAAAAVLGALLLSQTIWAHRKAPFVPESAPLELEPLLESWDLDTLTLQTGLSPSSLDALLDRGTSGITVMNDCQTALFSARSTECCPLIGAVTREDRLAEGAIPPPLAPLEPGDLLVTFSTHTLGWRHGHAGLVLDEDTVLEACQPVEDSAVFSVQHWRSYDQFLVLRVRDASPEERAAAVEFAREHLTGVPYRFLCGIWDSGGCHCAYLPWKAWSALGVDLDGDGGRIVTVADLAASAQLDVVQISGLDPALFAGRWAQ